MAVSGNKEIRKVNSDLSSNKSDMAEHKLVNK